MINHIPEKKRVLQKIRKQNIARKAEEREPIQIHGENLNPINEEILMINPCFGLVEYDRKIYIGTQYLNPYFNITGFSIDTQGASKAVTLNLQMDENNPCVPWEYAVKRLESYGDAELASWAYRIRKHHANYPNLMAKYFEMVQSQDPQVHKNLRKAKSKAILTCKEIESKYTYRKILTYSNKDSTEMLSVSYSENLLNEIGHSVDGFVAWSKENGIPTLFERECPFHLDIAKNFFECLALNSGPIQEGSDYVTWLYNKDGSKKLVLAQYVTITEPTHDGFFNSGYFIMKGDYQAETPPISVEKTDKSQIKGSRNELQEFQYLNNIENEKIEREGNKEKMIEEI